jgi:hypothetical protein
MHIFEGLLLHDFRTVGVSGTIIIPTLQVVLHLVTSYMLLLTVGNWKAQRWGNL